MSYMTFTVEHRDPFTDAVESKVTFETNNVFLPDILSDFESFLKGAGFHFDGILDIVPHETEVDFDEINATLEQAAREEDERRIYESPNKGETVFSRSFGGNPTDRTQR